mmetsp:Transcript_38918/g.59136  ORF Transcript_38918/g.59136 Transcript_38918/m.59136 type:complete len:110 (-) Transcript_38918:5425-5754(-)
MFSKEQAKVFKQIEKPLPQKKFVAGETYTLESIIQRNFKVSTKRTDEISVAAGHQTVRNFIQAQEDSLLEPTEAAEQKPAEETTRFLQFSVTDPKQSMEQQAKLNKEIT